MPSPHGLRTNSFPAALKKLQLRPPEPLHIQQEPGVLCGWLRSHRYIGSGSGLGSLVALSEVPQAPHTVAFQGLFASCHLGQLAHTSGFPVYSL